MTNDLNTKMRAAVLLRKYDQLRKELRTTEQSLSKTVTAYGRETGHWGLTKDHFRIQLDNEERIRLELAAERNAWEVAHA
jgi:environmental stress-induced protein Ves